MEDLAGKFSHGHVFLAELRAGAREGQKGAFARLDVGEHVGKRRLPLAAEQAGVDVFIGAQAFDHLVAIAVVADAAAGIHRQLRIQQRQIAGAVRYQAAQREADAFDIDKIVGSGKARDLLEHIHAGIAGNDNTISHIVYASI